SRTNTSMDRFVTYARPEDLFAVVDMPDRPPDELAAVRAKMVALPQVVASTRTPYMFLSPDRAGNEVGAINAFAAADASAYRTMRRQYIVQGRLPALDDAADAMIDDTTARRRHFRVGSKVTMW